MVAQNSSLLVKLKVKPKENKEYDASVEFKVAVESKSGIKHEEVSIISLVFEKGTEDEGFSVPSWVLYISLVAVLIIALVVVLVKFGGTKEETSY